MIHSSSITPVYRDSWRPIHCDSTVNEDGESYRRPLGNTELGFYWDIVFNGVATTIQHVQLEISEDSTYIMLPKNVERAWLRLKRRYPLLGSWVDESHDSRVVEFVVEEKWLSTIRPNELKYIDIRNSEEADKLIERLLNGPPTISGDLVSHLWVLRQKDMPRRYHLAIVEGHFITDGMANATLTRELCQELSSPERENQISLPPLRERLRSISPMEQLFPSMSLCDPRKRWRFAIARILYDIRLSKLQGGHALPRSLSAKNFSIPVVSRTRFLNLPETVTTTVLAACRKLRITFGNVLPVLSQIAHARVLHRLRSKGINGQKLNDKEWGNRLIQPMHFGGPLNARPYLDQDWYQNQGGASEVCLAISFFGFVLPFMPSSTLPAEQWADDGAPSFDSLMSRERFLLRSRMIRSQSVELLKHPLFLEFHAIRTPGRVERARAVAMNWRKKQTTGAKESDDSIENVNTSTMMGCIHSNGGASLGNRDQLIPFEYPLPLGGGSMKPRTTLRIIDNHGYLRCRPTELYLGASTSRQQLQFFVYWDSNVYADDLVNEWAEEVRRATVHYLGQDDQGQKISAHL